MYDFVLQIAIIASLMIIIYIMARALPRMSEDEFKSRRTNVFWHRIKQWCAKFPLAKADHFVSRYIEKTVRKTKVVVMRIDTLLAKHLNKKSTKEKLSSKEFIDDINNIDDII